MLELSTSLKRSPHKKCRQNPGLTSLIAQQCTPQRNRADILDKARHINIDDLSTTRDVKLRDLDHLHWIGTGIFYRDRTHLPHTKKLLRSLCCSPDSMITRGTSDIAMSCTTVPTKHTRCSTLAIGETINQSINIPLCRKPMFMLQKF